ncbi:Importin-like protein [Giardia muris]|uniref:Importin-like protein n=1 Tax=Giardia muris TaxID=5742 RepID=A0A4Z1T8G2_GIAMU|nr:Importin-like protein [Giardia muris]|eukprot:TNJ28801.1 Importin-like protein [Giardia muris]
MESLLDFDAPFQYEAFAYTVQAYTQNGDLALKQRAADILQRFQDDPRSGQYSITILNAPRTPDDTMVRFFGLGLLDSFIRRNWYLIPFAQQRSFYDYVMQNAQQFLQTGDVVQRRFVGLLVTLACYTYPSLYSSFITDMAAMMSVQADGIVGTDAQRSAILILTNFFMDYRLRTDLLHAQRQAIASQLVTDIKVVVSVLANLSHAAYKSSNDAMLKLLLELLTATLEACHTARVTEDLQQHYDSLSQFALAMLERNEELFTLGLQALSGLYKALAYSKVGLIPQMTGLFYRVVEAIRRRITVCISDPLGPFITTALSRDIQIDSGSVHIPATYPAANYKVRMGYGVCAHGNLTLSKMVCTALFQFVHQAFVRIFSELEGAALASVPDLYPTVQLSLKAVDDDAAKPSPHMQTLPLTHFRFVMRLILGLMMLERELYGSLNTTGIDIFTQVSRQSRPPSIQKPESRNRELHADILGAFVRFCLYNIPPPLEVLVYIDDYGNVQRKELDDGETRALFQAVETALESATRMLRDFSALNEATQLLTANFNSSYVNAIAWSLPAISRGLLKSDAVIAEQLNKLFVLSQNLVRQEDRICVGGGIVYMCSQLHGFFKANHQLLATASRKMLDFVQVQNEGLVEMCIRCFAHLMEHVQPTFFANPEFLGILAGAQTIVNLLPSHLIILLYTSICQQLVTLPSVFVQAIRPLFGHLEAAFQNWPPRDPSTLDIIRNVISVLSGACKGISSATSASHMGANQNAEYLTTTFTLLLPQTLGAYNFLNSQIVEVGVDPTLQNIYRTVRHAISEFLIAITRLFVPGHIHQWFILGSVTINGQTTDVGSQFLQMFQDYEKTLQGSPALADRLCLCFAEACFEAIVRWSKDQDEHTLVQKYILSALVPTSEFLANNGYHANTDLGDAMMQVICDMVRNAREYLQRRDEAYWLSFLQLVYQALKAMTVQNAFTGRYDQWHQALGILCELLRQRGLRNYEVIASFFIETVRFVNRGSHGSELHLLHLWWRLLIDFFGPDAGGQTFARITQAFTPEMLTYFQNGLIEDNEALMEDLLTVLSTFHWF